jgi:hypothetical protein
VARELPEQEKVPLVSVRVVDQDVDPALPVEERIDRERTKKLHEAITHGGKKMPLLVRTAQEQMRVVVPSPLELAAIDKIVNSGLGMCGACAHCDHAAGQELLRKKGGAWGAYEAMGRKIDLLPPWQNLGFCSEHECFVNVTSPAVLGSGPCPEFRERLAHKFGRMVGGAWKRLRDV